MVRILDLVEGQYETSKGLKQRNDYLIYISKI